MLLYRSDYYTDRAAANNKPGVITTNSFDNNTKDRNKLNVIVAKNRNGPVGNVRVFFDPVSGEVSDLLTE